MNSAATARNQVSLCRWALFAVFLGLWFGAATVSAQTVWDPFHQAIDDFEYEKATELARALPEGGPRELALAETAVLWGRYDLSFPQTDKIDPKTLPAELLSKYFLVRAYQERASEYPGQDQKDRAVSQMIMSGLRSAGSPHDRAHLLMLQLALAKPPAELDQVREAVRSLAELEGADPKFAVLAQARLAVKEERLSEAAVLFNTLADNAGLRGQSRAQALLTFEALDAESRLGGREPRVLRTAQELFEQTVGAKDAHAASLVYLLLVRLTPSGSLATVEQAGELALSRLDDSVGKLALIRRMAWVRDPVRELALLRKGAEIAQRLKEPVLEADFLLLAGNKLPAAEQAAAHESARALMASAEVRGLQSTWYGAARTLLRSPSVSQTEGGLAGLQAELDALDPTKGLALRAQLYGRYLQKAVRAIDAPLAESIFWMAFEEAQKLPASRRVEFLDSWHYELNHLSGWRALGGAPTEGRALSTALALALSDKLAGRPEFVESVFEGLQARAVVPLQMERDLAGWLSYLGRDSEATELLECALEQSPPGQKLASTYRLRVAQLEAQDAEGLDFLTKHGLDRQAPWRDRMALGWTALRLGQAPLAEELARLVLADPPTDYVELFRLTAPHVLLATALARQGKLDEAMAALDQGTQVDEERSVIGPDPYQLARVDILWRAGRKSEAAQLLGTLRPLPQLASHVQEWRLREEMARTLGDQTALAELDKRARDFLDLPTSGPADPITASRFREALGMRTAVPRGASPRPLSELVESLERLRRREPQNQALQGLSAAGLRQMMEGAAADEIDVVAVLLQRSVLLVYLTREECGLLEVFCHRPKLDAALATLSTQLSSAETVLPEEQCRYLSQRLVEPWRTRFPGKTKLCWMGHEALRQLPLSVLPDGNGRPLMENMSITYLDGPGRGSVKLGSQSPALLVGGASDLKGATVELKDVREVFPHGEAWQLGGDLDLLNTLVAKHGLVHVSTHGKAPTKETLGARLQGDQQSLDAFELANLTFPEHSLAVVATCESFIDAGTGRDNSSLVSAMRTAGASVVVGSLWQLDDDVTAQLFKEFYSHLAQGIAPDRALALAQRAIAKRWAHPYYWAGLQVVSGP